MVALSVGAAAQAKPVKHHRAAHAAAVSNAHSAEIEELKAQVQALTDRLNAQEASQQQAQAQAQQAQATAEAAASQAQAAQAAADAQIKTIPAQVSTAVAAIPKPKPGWEGSTSVSGRMYADVTNIDQKINGARPPAASNYNGTNFDIKRFYIGVDHKFNDTFSANVTTDFTYDGSVGATQLYLKKAYLQAKLNPALIVRLGSADMPWIPFVEDIYGYRYVENTLIDRTKFGTSADWGVHALGSMPVGGVTVSYALSAVNGSGYKKPSLGVGTGVRTDAIDVEGRLSASMDNFTAAVGGYTGKLGKDVQGVPTYHQAERFDALLAYAGPRFRSAANTSTPATGTT
ncbi:MAG: hypothetical protein WDM92_13700 [Caulobacteraceae bacterium]